MASWRDSILDDFGPGAPRLTHVADPDGLLLDEQISHDLRERGFDVATVEDPIAFRYHYESHYRAAWDRGEATERKLVVRAPDGDLNRLPYDLLQSGRTLRLGLPKLFPELNYPVLAKLDRGDLDRLWAERSTYSGKTMGSQATLDLVLQHAYGVDPNRFRNASDLLSFLLRLHRSGRPLPSLLVKRLSTRLREQREFADWPLDQILPQRDAFLQFLQERWPGFLRQIDPSQRLNVGEAQLSYNYAYPGPATLPFGDRDLRAEIQALFLDGALRPIAHFGDIGSKDEWAEIGIQRDPEADRLRRLDGLTARLSEEIPGANAPYGDWIEFAFRWGELVVLENAGPSISSTDLALRLTRLREGLDARFFDWARGRYGGLYNQADLPVMVHHIPRALAAYRQQMRGQKVALVVIDGLAIDQWIILREHLRATRSELHFDQSAAFAWVPTITPVSRQALFAGQMPAAFPSTIERTDRDASRWKSFWNGQKLADDQVDYLLLPGGDSSELPQIDRVLENPRLEILGLVVGTVDQMAHGIKLGKAGLHEQMRLWARGKFFLPLLDRLIAAGFTVVLTSDHGNVEAIGTGSLAHGVLATTRGERVRVYPMEVLRSAARASASDAEVWPPLGLPDKYFPLLAAGRGAFVPVGDRIVGHGGLSVEEVVVPYVVIRREAS